MNRTSSILLATLFALAACTSPGTYDDDDNSDALVIGPDTATADADPTDAGGGDTGEDSCGECTGETPVCDTETGTCVECLSDEDCTSSETPNCATDSNTCIACEPDERQEWYPDYDGDGFGDAEADPTLACEQPDGMVDSAEDCDDENHEVHPDAEEICNGRDDDCDGSEDTDDDVAPRDCELQEGLCEGATVATCTEAEGEAYVSCGAEQYGEAYASADDEDWRCDGLDNDCDGTTDEECCATDSSPAPVQIGADSADQAHPVLVPPAEDAPDDAAFLAVWAEGESIHLEHVDDHGEGTGATGSTTIDEVTSVDAVRTEDGYAVAATVDAAASSAHLVRFDDGLEIKGSEETFDSNTALLGRISIVFHDQTVWTTYFSENSADESTVRATVLDAQTGDVLHGPFDVASDSELLPQPGDPEIAVVDDTPTIAWWDPSSEEIRGVRLNEESVESRFYFPIDLNLNATFAEPIDLFAHDGSAHILHPDYTGSGESTIDYVSVDPGETGELAAGEAITGGSDLHRQPSAVPVSDDGMLVVWARGELDDPEIVVGERAMDASGQLSETLVQAGGDEAERPRLTVTGPKAGVTWLNTGVVSERDVKYAPLSQDGVPICE